MHRISEEISRDFVTFSILGDVLSVSFFKYESFHEVSVLISLLFHRHFNDLNKHKHTNI